MGEIDSLITYFNETGGIPLKITSVTATNWAQFGLTLIIGLVGSFFVFYMMYNLFKPQIITFFLKIKLRKVIKNTKKRMVIVKHTMTDLFGSSMIDGSTLVKLTKNLNQIGGKDFDLVLYTPGGEVFSTMYISNLLRNYPGKIRVIVPLYAMSGGTLLALSGDEIVMLPTSSLGPVDPQLGNLFKFGSAESWKHILKYKGKKSEDSTISFALMGEQYTKSISNHINFLLENKIKDIKQRKNFVKLLTSGEVEHGKIFTPAILKQYGLDVKIASTEEMKPLLKVLVSNGFEGVHLV